MDGHLRMSRQERERMKEFARVEKGELKLVDAAAVLRIRYRQAKRSWKRGKEGGDAGLIHRSWGRPSNRGKPAELKAAVLVRYKKRYGDFGPTLAAEKRKPHVPYAEG